MLTQSLSQFGDETSNALLELAVLGRVDKSVDTTVGVHQYHGELVKPASEVHTVIDVADENVNLEWSRTNDKFTTDNQ